MAFATVTFASNNTFAQGQPTGAGGGTTTPTQTPATGAATQDEGKKERVTAEQLPAEVVSAWTQSPNAQLQVSEINKVTKDDEVWYEVSYADAEGKAQKAKYKADGTEVKKDDKR
ncbi:hypothetical protein BH24BAC1_BH24BAC1_23270 [soil metagenome]